MIFFKLKQPGLFNQGSWNRPKWLQTFLNRDLQKMIKQTLTHYHLHHHRRAGDWFDVGNQRDWLYPPIWPSDFNYSIFRFNFKLKFSLWWCAFCLLCWHFFLLHRLHLFVTKSSFFKIFFLLWVAWWCHIPNHGLLWNFEGFARRRSKDVSV